VVNQAFFFRQTCANVPSDFELTVAGVWHCPAVSQVLPLDRFIREKIGSLSWNRTRRLISTGKISLNGTVVRDPFIPIRGGDVVEYNPNAQNTPTSRHPKVPLVFIDSQIVVVDKPAGISSVPFDKHERGTLVELVRQSLNSLERGRVSAVHVVHRIDKETSGIVVFARTQSSLKILKQLFRDHDIDRRYLAIVAGKLGNRTFSSRLVADRGDGKRGSTSNPRLGRIAITHVRSLEDLNSATLVECRLETGRTHQIRIQLAEAGHPILGERVYSASATALERVPRILLHAAHLAFRHPVTGISQEYSSGMPADMSAILQKLRAKN
jgi:23S rRNA pseudouridine1911/1915/1917 synthase